MVLGYACGAIGPAPHMARVLTAVFLGATRGAFAHGPR